MESQTFDQKMKRQTESEELKEGDYLKLKQYFSFNQKMENGRTPLLEGDSSGPGGKLKDLKALRANR